MINNKKVLLLFANNVVHKGLADPTRLKEVLDGAAARANSGIEVYTSLARSLSFYISLEKTVIRDHRNHNDLSVYDLVYFRKAGSAMQQMLTAALYIKDHNIPFFDAEIARSTSRNKLSQMYMLARRGVPVPRTLYCRNNRRLLRLVSTDFAAELPFPVIAKATGGTRGDANYLVKSLEELEQLLDNEKRHFIIQNFVPNDGDMRFFIVANKLTGVIRRRAVGDSHLNNTSQGGSAELVPLSEIPPQMEADALHAARIFGRDVAGVDVIVDKHTGEHFILEVNRAPQIEHASFETQKADWMIRGFENAIYTHQNDKRDGDAQPTFGRFEYVHLSHSDSEYSKLQAKIDTGADSSSVHATDIIVDGNTLSCVIEGERLEFKNIIRRGVRSSNGQVQHRYLVELPIRIGSTKYLMKATLTDRSDMKYSMLIGRRFLRAHNITVNVGRRYIASSVKKGKLS